MNAPLTANLSESNEPRPRSGIERLLDRFAVLYGSKFADQWGGVDPAEMKATWVECLHGYTAEEIQRGLKGCLSRDWPPTLPEFLKLCRPPVDFESTWREAIAQMAARESGADVWSHPAVYWTARQFGYFELRDQPWEKARVRWAALMTENMALADIPPVPARAPSLPPPKWEPPVETRQMSRAGTPAGHWRNVINPRNQYPLHSQRMARAALIELGVDVSRWEAV